MAKRRHQIKVNELSRMLVYMLGYRPAEFGIVPSRDGFVPVKELLKALHEEPGWRYVRHSHLNEVLLGKDRFLFESKSDRIRTLERKWDIPGEHEYLDTLPPILFAPVRRRAHPVVMEKGIIPAPGKLVVLSPDESMARRIGQRRDPKPVLLRVEAEKAGKEGTHFSLFDGLYLCREVAARYIAGPPVAKDLLKAAQEKEVQGEDAIRLADAFSAGTFPLDLDRDPASHHRGKGKKRKSWKESARKMRRKNRE